MLKLSRTEDSRTIDYDELIRIVDVLKQKQKTIKELVGLGVSELEAIEIARVLVKI